MTIIRELCVANIFKWLRTTPYIIRLFVMACCLSLAFISHNALAAQEVLKTSKVLVGERVDLTDTLKEENERGKIIVLVLLSNPMQCSKCDELVDMLEKESKSYKNNVVFIMAGGQDMTGAANEEVIKLKRQFGFVTIGQPWIFIIDKGSILRNIFIGPFTKQELKEALTGIIGKAE